MWIRLQRDLMELVPASLSGGALVVGFLVLAVMFGSTSLAVLGLGGLSFYIASRPLAIEVERGTLGRLLAQPLPRARIWWEKHLAVVLVLSVVVGLLAAFLIGVGYDLQTTELWWLLPLVALATGAGWPLVFRQSTVSAWVAMLVPLVIYGLATLVWSLIGGEQRWPRPSLVLVPYAVTGMLVFYRRFLRLQLDGQAGIGRAVAGPAAGRWFHRADLKLRRPTVELLRKELSLQRSSAVLLGLVALGWLLCGLWGASIDRAPAVASSAKDIQSLSVWLLSAISCVVLPLLIGANMISGERRIGALSWQLCLPVARRQQWRIKLLVALSLTLTSTALAVLGVPGMKAFAARPQPLGTAGILNTALGTLIVALVAMGIGVLGSRHGDGPLRALGVTFVLGPAVFFVWQVAAFAGFLGITLWPGNVVMMAIILTLVPSGLLVAWLLRAPSQEEWLAGRSLRRSLVGLVPVLALSVGLQLLLLARTAHELEREIVLADQRLVEAGVEDSDRVLRPAWEFEDFAGQLMPIIDYRYERYGGANKLPAGFEIVSVQLGEPALVDRSPDSLMLGNPKEGFSLATTPAMTLVAMFDGVVLTKETHSRRFWRFRFQYQLHNHPDSFRPAGEPWRWKYDGLLSFASMARIYGRQHRLELLDHRMRQEVALIALSVLKHTDGATLQEPEFRALVERSPLEWSSL